MQEAIKELLLSTKRKGIDLLYDWMCDNGFFDAPCSTSHHLAMQGGLAKHSYNVWDTMQKLFQKLGSSKSYITPSNIIICALLHDLGKVGDYGKPNYVPNMINSRKKDADGNFIFMQSDAKPYETNKNLLYLPHEVRSVKIASRFIELTEQEEWAILMHNGLYGDFKYDIQGKETELYLLLHMADMWASRVIEA